MFKHLTIACVLFVLLLADSSFAAQCTGGDKGRKISNSSVQVRKHSRVAEPPDPLVAHKSPGRNKRHRRHRRHRHS